MFSKFLEIILGTAFKDVDIGAQVTSGRYISIGNRCYLEVSLKQKAWQRIS